MPAGLLRYEFRDVPLNSFRKANHVGNFIFIREPSSAQNGLYRIEALDVQGKIVANFVTPAPFRAKTPEKFKDVKITVISNDLATADFELFCGEGDLDILNAGNGNSSSSDPLFDDLADGDVCVAFAATTTNTSGGATIRYRADSGAKIVDRLTFVGGSGMANMQTTAFLNRETSPADLANAGFILPQKSDAAAFVDSFTWEDVAVALPPNYFSVIEVNEPVPNKVYEVDLLSPIYLAQNDALTIQLNSPVGLRWPIGLVRNLQIGLRVRNP